MGLGQTIITTFFLVLLTIAAVNANKLIVDKSESFYQQDAYRQASVYANALLNEILSRKFDNKIVIGDTTTYLYRSDFGDVYTSGSQYWKHPFSLSAVNPGGAPDTYPFKTISGASGSYALLTPAVEYYDGYVRWVKSPSLPGFTLKVKIRYVSESKPDSIVNHQQYIKKIFVTVSDSSHYIINKNGNVLEFSALSFYTF